jgi:tRNA(adenine34) deaminase
LRDAANALGRWRLDDCSDGGDARAVPDVRRGDVGARIGGVVSGAENTDAGALGTLYHLGSGPRLNHEFPVRAEPGAGRARAPRGAAQAFFADR